MGPEKNNKKEEKLITVSELWTFCLVVGGYFQCTPKLTSTVGGNQQMTNAVMCESVSNRGHRTDRRSVELSCLHIVVRGVAMDNSDESQGITLWFRAKCLTSQKKIVINTDALWIIREESKNEWSRRPLEDESPKSFRDRAKREKSQNFTTDYGRVEGDQMYRVSLLEVAGT